MTWNLMPVHPCHVAHIEAALKQRYFPMLPPLQAKLTQRNALQTLCTLRWKLA